MLANATAVAVGDEVVVLRRLIDGRYAAMWPAANTTTSDGYSGQVDAYSALATALQPDGTKVVGVLDEHAASHFGGVDPYKHLYPMLRYLDSSDETSSSHCLTGTSASACGEEGAEERRRRAAEVSTWQDRAYKFVFHLTIF